MLRINIPKINNNILPVINGAWGDINISLMLICTSASTATDVRSNDINNDKRIIPLRRAVQKTFYFTRYKINVF